MALAGLTAAALPAAHAAARGGGMGFRGGSGMGFRGSSGSSFGARYGGSGAGFGGGHYGNNGAWGSHFGFTLHGNNYRVSYGTSHYPGYGYGAYHRGYGYGAYYAPSYSYPYYGGFYPYYYPFTSGVYLSTYPSYANVYPAETQPIYIYPPPVVRYYNEPAPASTQEPGRTLTPVPKPHPYDQPAAVEPEKGSLEEALGHIRTAWLREDVDVMRPHLPTGDARIALYHDGELRQELSATEFTRLTRDAVRETRTIRFRFAEIRRPEVDEATAFALHTYVEEGRPDTEARTVTLHYDLARRDGVWTLKAVHVIAEEKPEK